MSGWPVFWLGMIAISLFIIAILSVTLLAVLIFIALKAMRGVQQLNNQIQPLIEKVNRITDDAGRATSLVLGQVERIDDMMRRTTERVEDVVSSLHSTVLGPVKHGAAILAGLRAALSVFWNRQERTRPARDDEDAMFIG